MTTHKGRKNSRLPRPRTEGAEYPKGYPGVLVCKYCHSFYYNKSWHLHLNNELKDRKKFHRLKTTFAVCPACKMIRGGNYEGEVLLKKVPKKFETEILSMVRGFAHKAYMRDPMDRIIEMKRLGKGLRITTTENVLAQKIGKHIHRSFKGKSEIEFHFSEAPNDVERVVVTFN